MNRDGEPQVQGIRLDPEPEATAAEAPPDKILHKGASNPPEPEAEEEDGDPTKLLEKMEKDQRLAEEDEKFLEEYKGVDLMQMIMEGYIQHEVTVIDGMKVLLRTLTDDEDDEISKRMEDMKGNQVWLGNQIVRTNLAYVVVAINGAKFGEDVEDRMKRIGKWGKPIKLVIWEEWIKLNKAVAMKIRGGRSGNSLEHRLIGQESVY